METKTEPLIDGLYRLPGNGKAEIINGRIVLRAPAGFGQGRIGGNIYTALRAYKHATGEGFALPGSIGFIVGLPNRQSFSPDAAFVYTRPENREKFVTCAPVFAAEIRSENDHGVTADREYREKRADYFHAGTSVVWDVNPRDRTIDSYRHDRPDDPARFRIGDEAEAAPALPGWRVAVAEIFAP